MISLHVSWDKVGGKSLELESEEIGELLWAVSLREKK